jgi:hypothetical protein
MSTQEAEPPKVAGPSTETKATESSTETKATEPLKKKDCSKRTWSEFIAFKECPEVEVGVSNTVIPVTTTGQGSVPATGVVAAPKAGGWFSRGGKRKSKAKKSRRKNRKQKKSRKSRK